mmetsp:Transcript_1572/g.4009  ORF Transcript_1572/g.4009 Transcript_1572/m.4009 type:complete len:271 (+) Transcript_1572:998-1810(+)
MLSTSLTSSFFFSSSLANLRFLSASRLISSSASFACSSIFCLCSMTAASAHPPLALHEPSLAPFDPPSTFAFCLSGVTSTSPFLVSSWTSSSFGLDFSAFFFLSFLTCVFTLFFFSALLLAFPPETSMEVTESPPSLQLSCIFDVTNDSACPIPSSEFRFPENCSNSSCVSASTAIILSRILSRCVTCDSDSFSESVCCCRCSCSIRIFSIITGISSSSLSELFLFFLALFFFPLPSLLIVRLCAPLLFDFLDFCLLHFTQSLLDSSPCL